MRTGRAHLFILRHPDADRPPKLQRLNGQHVKVVSRLRSPGYDDPSNPAYVIRKLHFVTFAYRDELYLITK